MNSDKAIIARFATIIVEGEMSPGATLEIEASGFEPLSLVQFYLESTPVLIGEAFADANGMVKASIVVPEDFPLGSHTLVAVGVDQGGTERRVERPVVITLSEGVFSDGFEG